MVSQRWQSALGLYYYNARWWQKAKGFLPNERAMPFRRRLPKMRRFVQADTDPSAFGAWAGPEPGNPQALNRYAYSYNNPISYSDPSGHNPLAGALQFAQSPVGQQLINWATVNWGQLQAQAQALVVQYAPYVTQWAQASGPYSPMLAEKANQASGRMRDAGNQGGQFGGSNGLDPNKWGPIREQLIRDELAKNYDQPYGSTDEAIRQNLGIEGKCADYVGYHSGENQWLIGESKGSDMAHAAKQLQNTYNGLIRAEPGAAGKAQLEIYVSSNQYSRLLSDGGLAGYIVQNTDTGVSILGWNPGTGFVPQLIDGIEVTVRAWY